LGKNEASKLDDASSRIKSQRRTSFRCYTNLASTRTIVHAPPFRLVSPSFIIDVFGIFIPFKGTPGVSS
jgi:hypothetical protein